MIRLADLPAIDACLVTPEDRVAGRAPVIDGYFAVVSQLKDVVQIRFARRSDAAPGWCDDVGFIIVDIGDTVAARIAEMSAEDN